MRCLLFIISILIFLFNSCNKDKYDEKKYEIISGISKLPEIECYDLEGKKEIISHKSGEILVLNIWGINCGPCVSEIPGLNKLVEKYKENNNVRFIALTSYYTKTQKLKNFFKEHKFEFEQRLIKTKYFKILNIKAIPVTIICNQEGIIIYYIVGGGPNMYKYIDKIINTLLNGGILTI